MTHDVLSQILILLAGSVLVLSLVRRVALPPILGYLLVGMMLGPSALDLVTNEHAVMLLAEFGVVFLVFTLGLEFSLARMVAMKSEVSVMPSRAQASPSTRLSSEKYSSGLFLAGVAESR